MSLWGQLSSGIAGLLNPFFDDASLTTSLTWKLFKGHETAFVNYSVLALNVEHLLDKDEMESRTAIQKAERSYIIRESDLPSGLTKALITENDRITAGSVELVINELDKSVPGYLYVEALGNQ